MVNTCDQKHNNDKQWSELGMHKQAKPGQFPVKTIELLFTVTECKQVEVFKKMSFAFLVSINSQAIDHTYSKKEHLFGFNTWDNGKIAVNNYKWKKW